MSEPYLIFNECIEGFYGGNNSVMFSVRAETPAMELLNQLEKKPTIMNLTGIIRAQGICDERDIDRGTLSLDFLGEHKLKYHIVVNDCLELNAEKNLHLTAPIFTMTHAYGTVKDVKNNKTYQTVCRFDLFDLDNLGSFVKSFFTESCMR